ncbi:glycosyltransferase family 2 protein [Rheinheimera baltica]|uniref:glycosyltransferase family 2 protein n=1 Tax=Rheinheimera baltica TaxID=67576 RepID=UPI00273DFEEC|nr:glycosyltransferase family 2 protein [Rheinheimera baltica]MDP5149749.1 glycosyltransferase family 2 protein [Rheinheimera baltica]
MMTKLAVAAIFKNELPYIMEWVAYHQLIGVDRIIVADNVSDDGSSGLLEALSEAGIIERLHFPRLGDAPPQPLAYNAILKKYGSEFDLIAFIDADEFIMAESADENPIDILKALYQQQPDLGAIALNWRVYGSSRQYYEGTGLVLERFSCCADEDFPINNHIKSVVVPDKVAEMIVHYAQLKSGVYYTATGHKASFAQEDVSGKSLTVGVCHQKIILNHYITKSYREHYNRKYLKGSAAGEIGRRKGQEYFNGHDRSDEYRPVSAGLLIAVREHISLLHARLHSCSPYYSNIRGHIDAIYPAVVGWVSSNNLHVKVKVLIDRKIELIAEMTVSRPDVVDAGISVFECCGFEIDLPEGVNAETPIEVSVYGTNLRLYPAPEWVS